VGIINSLAIDVHGYPHINYYYDYVPGIRLMSLSIIGVEEYGNSALRTQFLTAIAAYAFAVIYLRPGGFL